MDHLAFSMKVDVKGKVPVLN